MEAKRSTSRTGRTNPSTLSMAGTGGARDSTGCLVVAGVACRASCPRIAYDGRLGVVTDRSVVDVPANCWDTAVKAMSAVDWDGIAVDGPAPA